MSTDVLARHGTAASAYMLATLLYCGSPKIEVPSCVRAHVELSCPTPWPYSLKGTHIGCVRTKRAPSDSYYLPLGEWPRLPFTARIEGPPFHHGASASKKDGLATPSLLLNDHEQLVTKTYGKCADPRFFLSNAVCPYSLSLILARRVCDLSRLPLHDR
jgi:hypothetical protein